MYVIQLSQLGTHPELLKKRGLYYNLVKQQEYKSKTGNKS
jgi:ABC-type multidrug transport system fused ATPase/permease subunit